MLYNNLIVKLRQCDRKGVYQGTCLFPQFNLED